MRRFAHACLVAASCAGVASAQTPLDLPRAIDLALAQNLALTRAALSVRNAEFSIASARAEFGVRWQPDGESAATQDGDSLQAGLTARRKFLPGTEVSAGGQWRRSESDSGAANERTSWRVDLTQPLFRDFGALVQGDGITRAEQQLRSARRDIEEQRADLVLQVVETFETLIRLERQIESDEASLVRRDKMFRLTRAREKQGRSTRVDTLRAELQRGQAQSRLESTREQLSSTTRDFAELLGLPTDSRFALTPPPLLDVDVPPAADAVRIALQNRLDYAQTLQDAEDARRTVRIAAKGIEPSLSIRTRYERFEPVGGAEEPQDLWLVALSGDTDLGRRTERARLGQAVVSRDAAEQTVSIRETTIARDVQQRITGYQQARGELGIANRNFDLAERRARLARRLFEVGRGDSFSVSDAEDAVTDAEDQLRAARSAASIAGYRLLRSLGTLTETPGDLRPPRREESL